MRFARAATLPLSITHRGEDGILHGHDLAIEVWTRASMCLDRWRSAVAEAIAPIGTAALEDSIGGRTFEDVAEAVLARLPGAFRVVVRVPDLGHAVEAEGE